MNYRIAGLHHITAIATSVQRNYEFYTKLLGLRLVKKTVNMDDPGAYHLYYGNKTGDPGTILSILPWENIGPGYEGTGMATEISFSVPPGSLEAWKERLQQFNPRTGDKNEGFGEEVLHCSDPDGLKFNLVVPGREDARQGWHGGEVPEAMAVKGLHSISLMVQDTAQTAQILTGIFGYTLAQRKGNKSRFVTDAAMDANIIDLVEMPDGPIGYVAGGTVHHVSFRVNSDEALTIFRGRLLSQGLSITPKTDVTYFSSFYFREPGGALFELASDKPGLTVDETVEELGSQLKLPARLEYMRNRLEGILPPLSR
ncbi:VOC family protein [Flavitalea sp. BT771]|uniref:VOC family protein n=1 Tax=Flavitalea sp. BT771 TaxID=3063329 RepID=UPI0026E2CE14|nr:VOC family protein [Flavitalea sp. BT771]MDO6429581.1 VOC family protein [Flavitalea sp. BT771]MDV6218291.1 VOC family protein [Flavitalea sp. BT771]